MSHTIPVQYSIWLSNPHPLRGGQRDTSSIEEAIERVYGVSITYHSLPYGYDSIEISHFTSRRQIEAVAKALQFLHLKWIREDIRLPWNGVVIASITKGQEQPDWVCVLDRAHNERLADRA